MLCVICIACEAANVVGTGVYMNILGDYSCYLFVYMFTNENSNKSIK